MPFQICLEIRLGLTALQDAAPLLSVPPEQHDFYAEGAAAQDYEGDEGPEVALIFLHSVIVNEADDGRDEECANVLKACDKAISCSRLMLTNNVGNRSKHQDVVHCEPRSEKDPRNRTGYALVTAGYHQKNYEGAERDDSLYDYYGLAAPVQVDAVA